MRLFHQLGFGVGLLAATLAAHALDLPGPVVNTEWLARNRAQVQVVEVRSDPASYLRQPVVETDKKSGKKVVVEVGGHMNESRLLDMKHMRTDRQINGLTVKFMLPEKADFERVIQAAGVEAGKPVVLVPMGQDLTDIDDALRTYWQFKVYGQDQVAVLDGGMAAWLLEGREYSVAPAAPHKGNWHAGKEHLELMAGSDDAAAASAAGAQLVDARTPPQYYGLSKRDVVSSYGHIAGARMVSPDLLTRQVQGVAYFFSADTYRSIFETAGVDPSKPAITYCNTGHLASGPWFMLSEVLGNKSTRLYDGSMHEWTMEKRPTVGVKL